MGGVFIPQSNHTNEYDALTRTVSVLLTNWASKHSTLTIGLGPFQRTASPLVGGCEKCPERNYSPRVRAGTHWKVVLYLRHYAGQWLAQPLCRCLQANRSKRSNDSSPGGGHHQGG